MYCPDCGDVLRVLIADAEKNYSVLLCLVCEREWMMDDDGHLYDPSDPPGPLWSLSLHDYV